MTVETREQVVRYVIAVHGIGEQRENETVLPVINRFAEARFGATFGDPLTLGILASQLEVTRHDSEGRGRLQGWIEFEGIPAGADPGVDPPKPFVGRRADLSEGANLRFVDMHWAQVMGQQWESVGEPVASWTRSLIDRLRIRNADTWILEMLGTMRGGVIPLQKLLGMKLPGLSDEIFNRFLGDVELYGDYLKTRGRAVKKFHKTLARIHRHHAEEFAHRKPEDRPEPRYTVISHSLGSIMAFDALMFAHGQPLATNDRLLGLLPGYGEDPEDPEREADGYPDLRWIRHVDALVTLGSPIDKFLILWWLNYEHLGDQRWMNPELVAHRKVVPIRHFNYCDEQDPVGHELDVAYSTAAVKTVFGDHPVEEVVFSRYSRPGVAHVDYWTDLDLFTRVLDLAVDGRKPEESQRKVAWFKLGTYVRSVLWSYLVIPIFGWVLATGSMIWALNGAGGSGGRWTAQVFSLIVLLATCWVITLVVQWRQVMVSKRSRSRHRLPQAMRVQRAVARTVVQVLICILPLVWIYGAGSSGIALIASHERQSAAAQRTLEDRTALEGADSRIASRLTRSLMPGAKLVTRLPDFLNESRIFGWQPLRVREGPVLSSVFIGFCFAFLLGLWNLLVFVRMKIKWSFTKLELNFPEYLSSDPTRPTTDGNG